MTKGDRDRIRAEIAGRVAQGLFASSAFIHSGQTRSVQDAMYGLVVDRSVGVADLIMDRLGLSEEAEQAEIQREAERRRGGVS